MTEIRDALRGKTTSMPMAAAKAPSVSGGPRRQFPVGNSRDAPPDQPMSEIANIVVASYVLGDTKLPNSTLLAVLSGCAILDGTPVSVTGMRDWLNLSVRFKISETSVRDAIKELLARGDLAEAEKRVRTMSGPDAPGYVITSYGQDTLRLAVRIAPQSRLKRVRPHVGPVATSFSDKESKLLHR